MFTNLMFHGFIDKTALRDERMIERERERERERGGMTCSEGPQVRLEPVCCQLIVSSKRSVQKTDINI